MLKLKRLFSCFLAITTILGGNIMSTKAVTNETATQDVAYAHELDALAYQGSDLGATYTPNATIFKVWAPTASNVAVKLYTTGSSNEPGAQNLSTTTMMKGNNGVWTITIDGDLKNRYYTYVVTVDGVSRETADVYSKAVGVNGNRSMIVDLPSTNPDGWDKDQHILVDDPTDAIVWEVHIRDFSKSEISGVSLKHRGKYLAFTETGTTLGGKGDVPTCIDYLKKLGVTHVQLMPVYDYATVDESQEDPEEYNWGYDPKNYNVPEGSYSTNAFDGNVRIREFKQMIQALHQAGIGVIMDVVYNHTYTAEGSCFENTVPGYYFRMNEDGSFADASACGDETASDHLMYRKYMIDSVLYWINEYHIDGFRFDLMGIHDVETMNLIRKEVDEKVTGGKKIILYGEPWAASAVATKEKTCTKDNLRMLDSRIGAFNDSFRDAAKGHVFNATEKGFVQNGSDKAALMSGIAGSCLGNNPAVNAPSQSIAYVSAHDNFTLYDKLVLSVKNDESFSKRDEEILRMNRMAAAITLTSQGISFMQAGEEFARTKYGDDNSFVSSDKINMLDWNNLVTYADLVSYYRGLMEIRRCFKPFRDPTVSSASAIAFSDAPDGVIAYTLSNDITKGKEWSYIAVGFNSTDKDVEVTLKQSGKTELPKKWEIVADGTQAGLISLGQAEGSKITIPAGCSIILADKESFDSLALKSGMCRVTAEYVNSETGDVITKRVFKGEEGSSYQVSRGSFLDMEYDYESVDGEENGRFTHQDKTITYKYKKFPGKIYSIKVNYLRKGDTLLGGGESQAGKSDIYYQREGSTYAVPVRNIDGLVLDLDSFPAEACGKLSSDCEVNFYYDVAKPADLVLHYHTDENNAYVQLYKDGKAVEGGMKKLDEDSSLGNGWFSLTVKDLGNEAGITARFSDTDKLADTAESYSVKRESWISDGSVTGAGEVIIVHIQSGGSVLNHETISGKVGESYKTTEKTFDGLKLISSTDNSSGTYTDSPICVIYVYDEQPLVEGKNIKTALMLCGGALVTLAAALVLGGIYRSRKKKAL